MKKFAGVPKGEVMGDFPWHKTPALDENTPNIRITHPGMIKVDFSPNDICGTPWSQPAQRQRRTGLTLGQHTWNDPANADLNLESSSSNRTVESGANAISILQSDNGHFMGTLTDLP